MALMIFSPTPPGYTDCGAALLCSALPGRSVDWTDLQTFPRHVTVSPGLVLLCGRLCNPAVSSYGLVVSATSRVPRHARRTLHPPGAGVSNQIHRFKISISATDDCFCTARASREIYLKTARLAPQPRKAFQGTCFAKMIKANQADLARPSMESPPTSHPKY